MTQEAVPAPGAVPLQVSSALLALDQVTFTADDPQFVLVGRGQVDGPRGNGGAKVARVWNVQMCIRVGSETQRKWCLTEGDVYPAASVLTRIYPKDECPSISITSRELK